MAHPNEQTAQAFKDTVHNMAHHIRVGSVDLVDAVKGLSLAWNKPAGEVFMAIDSANNTNDAAANNDPDYDGSESRKIDTSVWPRVLR